MTERQRLPDRRETTAVEFAIDGTEYIAHFGNYVGGGLAEVFLTGTGRVKPNSGLDILAKDAALILSIALQHGVPLSIFQEAMSRLPSGRPAGPMGVIIDIAMGKDGEVKLPTPGLDPQDTGVLT